ncbi:MFS multidrug transporter [Penicillium riverlandense]|uniref:MFS multidrug transporter n=1 Tax=Penicillium riverlandense TaxID=1903569 RepID=UPI0025472ACC|nr:MFS multidrug transporter [Penicillium riverlandense]KAJ5808863.1 MFS multidrug transporter [Penicillium riverlandense]
MVSSTSDSLAVASPTAAEPDARSVHTSMDLAKPSPSQSLSKEGSLADEEKHAVPQAGETAAGPDTPNIVDWDGPDDPGNPVNFSGLIKFTNVGIISALTFITPLASSMFAPGVPQLMEEFHSSSTLLAGFVVSVYVLGFAIGPLILAPASELLGRAIIYHVCNIGFAVFTVGCAVSTNLGMLIAFRFFQGCFGSAPVTNGTIADLIVQEKRGGVIAIYALGPLLGPVIGPVAGGYLTAAKGWRWVFWVLTIVSGACTVVSFLFLRETYPTVLLKRKTQRLIKETGNTDLRSKRDKGLSTSQLFIQAIIRPSKILLLSPIVSASSVYVGIVYGYQYLMFSTFTYVFEDQYGFPTKSSGLTFLGIGVGSLLGLFVIGAVSDRILKAKSKPTPQAPSGVMKPEYRLPPLVVGAFFIPAGLFLYGWSVYYKTHWILPMIGTALVGIGNIAVFMCITSYLVDAFTIYAASALAANTVVRSIMGALLPLAGQSMYQSMGLGWGNSLLGFIAVVCIPVPWAMMRYGERMRTAFDLSRL